MSDINWEEKYEKETGEDPTCWNIPYAGAKPEKWGMTEAYNEWIKSQLADREKAIVERLKKSLEKCSYYQGGHYEKRDVDLLISDIESGTLLEKESGDA